MTDTHTITVIYPDGRSSNNIPCNKKTEWAALIQLIGDNGQTPMLEVVPGLTKFAGKRCVAWCDEEGLLKHLPYNQPATLIWKSQLSDPSRAMLVGIVCIVTKGLPDAAQTPSAQ